MELTVLALAAAVTCCAAQQAAPRPDRAYLHG